MCHKAKRNQIYARVDRLTRTYVQRHYTDIWCSLEERRMIGTNGEIEPGKSMLCVWLDNDDLKNNWEYSIKGFIYIKQDYQSHLYSLDILIYWTY